MSTLPYESFVPAEYKGVTRSQFVAKVRQIASLLKIPAEWLMVVFYKESRLKPSAKNPKSTATGLIQWLESTATKTHGVTTAQIADMNGLEQLDLVYAYYKPSVKKLNRLIDAYLAVHYPVGVGKALNYVLYKKGTPAYAANMGLDLNGDGSVTVADVGAWLGNGNSVDPYSPKTSTGEAAETAKKKS